MTSKTNSNEGLMLEVPVTVPYDWDTVLSYLKGHECYGIESISNDTYRRFFSSEQGVGSITVSSEASQGFLAVSLVNIPIVATHLVIARVKSLFDTDHNPARLPSTESLQPLGIRVPGCFDPFETAVSIILGQLIAVSHARVKLKSLVQRFGRYLSTIDTQEIYQFPSAEDLFGAPIWEIGITRVKAHAIRELAGCVMRKEIDFTAQMEFADAYKNLLAIKGIGPWTASMILMRCHGDPDAFPHADLIVQRAIEQKLADHAVWTSSRAYLTHCLWRDYSRLLSKVSLRKLK